MSSVGFSSTSSANEVERLREACQSLNDVLKGIASAQACLELQNFGLAKDHLKAAHWHAGEVKKVITALGREKTSRRSKSLETDSH